MELVRTAALITGGASGLGAAAARALAAAGCMTVVGDVDARAGAKSPQRSPPTSGADSFTSM